MVPNRCHRRVGARLRGVGIGDVGADELGLALAGERGHRRRAAFLGELGHHDLGSLGQEPLGVAEPDALPGAGDDRDLAVEPTRRAHRIRPSGGG